jgi:hypothetical protein
MPQDPSVVIDIQGLNEAADMHKNYADRLKQETETKAAVQQETEAEETQTKAELKDPRDSEQWGLKALAKEGQSILSGGLQDTASSLTTFPERTIDAFSGEMARESKKPGGYRPDWDPFVDHENPIITKTWWGKLARGAVHFGSLAAAIIPAAKVTAARLGVGAAWAGAHSMVRAAGVGAVSDIISKESDGHNALGALRKQYGFIDTPITTQDSDHPVVMKVKNIMEGMGIGAIFDGLAIAIGKGSKSAYKLVESRNASIKKQDIENGLVQLRRGDQGMRAAKNRPVADAHQGADISEQTAYEAWETNKKTRTDWGSEEGSTGSVTTPVQRERIAREGDVSEATAESILRNLYSSDKFRAVVEQAKRSRKTLVEVFGDSILAHQRITQGRNAAELTASEYLEELWRSKDTYEVTNAAGEVIDTIETFTSKNIVVADLTVGTLLHQIRDTGIAGRELADIVDLGDIDGPAAQIVDTMLTALQETKKARIIKSDNFRQIGAGKQREFLESTLTQEMADTRESIMTILKIAKDDADTGLMNALFETFSAMKTVHNLDDWDSFSRKMIKGGRLTPDGPDQTGVLIRELEGMFVNSILSGPKTPLRAILGTSSATFLRPFAMTFGAAMRYPFTGDTATIRAGLASMNAMMEAIPESWTLFKERLNSYWAGDISNIKSRYVEHTRNDNNWEILRRWVESGRATDGDKAAFAMANMARNANNSNLLTYSTKLMAATDDAFGYILGRAKAREKAMRNVLDIQSSGGKTPEITRELMQAYEQDFYGQIWDANGDITDEAVNFAKREVTLTQPLTGFSKGLNDVFTANPWAKPFFLFARTGINGLSLTAKHTPGFNFLVKEWNEIAFASPNDLSEVIKYGITTPEELLNAKALQVGRLGMGTAVVSMASWSWMSGNMTGNGPADRQKRQMWLDAGWRPRHVKIGDVWVGYESIEPFNQIMSLIADIGDNSLLMGSEWTEKELLKTSLVLAQGIASKSYLAGMQQFVDLFAGRQGQAERIIAGLLNNTVPLAGLRNEMGKLFTPYTRELGSGIDQALRNRNLISENLPGDDLPIKYDILNGRPIKDHDFLTRAFNAFSPISLNLDHSPGRKLLFDSGYDMRLSTYYSPRGDNLSDSPRIRSMFQKALGDQNLEYQLTVLSRDPKIQESIRNMNMVIDSGQRGDYEAGDFYHNIQIDRIMNAARKRAWASIMNDPAVYLLTKQQKQKKLKRRHKTLETRGSIDQILSIPK